MNIAHTWICICAHIWEQHRVALYCHIIACLGLFADPLLLKRSLSWRGPFWATGLDVSGNISRLVCPTLVFVDCPHYLSSAFPPVSEALSFKHPQFMSYPGSYSFRSCNFSKQLAPCFSERRPFSKADSKTWAVPPARSKDVEQSSGRTGSSLVTSTGKMGVGRSKRTWQYMTSMHIQMRSEGFLFEKLGYGSIFLATITRNYWIAQIQMSHMFPWSGRFNSRLAADSQHLNSSSTSLTFQQVWFMGSYRLAIWNLLAFGN